MAVVDKATLKSYFDDGDVPVESNYVDLIDSLGIPTEAILVTGDWNDVLDTGFYRGNQLTNGPSSSYYYVLVIRHADTYVVQEAWYYYSVGNPEKYIRRKVNGTWESWDQIYPAQWGDIESKPATYPPSSHTHPGGEITSQVSDADTVDSLHAASFVRSDADDTKSGDLRMSGGLVLGSTSDLAANGELRATDDLYPDNQEAGLQYRNDSMLATIFEHFDVSSRPSGWSLSGVMSDSYSDPSNVKLSGAIGLGYLYRTLVSIDKYYAGISPTSLYSGSNCGIRLELSTDTTYYVEYIVKYDGTDWELMIQYRSGSGDSNHEVSGGVLSGYPAPFHMCLAIGGTRWSSWSVSGLLRSPGSPGFKWAPNTAVSGLTWTPDRMGFKAYSTGATWEAFHMDYFEY